MENDFVKPENKLTANYYRTRMQKELVLQRLKEKGCRITKQRKILLDIILQEECASCKEIYYKAASTDGFPLFTDGNLAPAQGNKQRHLLCARWRLGQGF